MTLKELFEQSVAASKSLPQKPDNETLLKLYSLYKQATSGDAPDEGTYGMFDFTGKAKHEAWEALRGLTREKAMQQYVDLVRLLQDQIHNI